MKTLIIFFAVTLLVACTQLPPKELTFAEAIHTMANKLLKQAKNHQEIPGQPSTLVLKPLVDANSKRVVKVSGRIEQIIQQEIQQNFAANFLISPLNLKNLHKAQYLISGFIDFTSDNEAGHKQVLVLMTSKTGKTLSSSEIWVPMADSDSQPISKYQSSPMYLTNRNTSEFETNNSVIQLTNQEFYNSLDTKALLAEAETAYEQQDYQKALSLFNLTTKRPQGESVRTYANLYQTHLKLQNQSAARKAFKHLLEASVQESNKLKQNFFFAPNSVEFINDEELRNEYLFWIQQIGEYFASDVKCFHIVGYRDKKEAKPNLALLRAQKIQQMLQEPFPQLNERLRSVDKGYDKSNGMFSTMKRRVEIVVVECSKL